MSSVAFFSTENLKVLLFLLLHESFLRNLLLLFTPVFFLQNTFTFTQVVLRAITFTFTQVQLKSYSSQLCLFGGLGVGFYPHMHACMTHRL